MRIWTFLACTLSAMLLTLPLNAAMVSGVLLNDSGQASSRTTLLFVNSDTKDETETATDEEGSFDQELPAGQYEVYEKDDTGNTYLTKLELDANEKRKVELKLPERQQSALDAIRDFELGTASTRNVDSESLANVINPFPARKRGRVHGSIYEFHRNDNFDARNFFDPFGEPLPEYKRNQFGVTLGAFFGSSVSVQGSFDGLRINKGSTLLSHVPTEAMREGDFSELDFPLVDPLTGERFAENRIPLDRFSSVSSQVLAVIPLPNREDPDRNFVNNDPVVRDQNVYSFRGDYEASTASKFVFDYSLVNEGSRLVRPFSTFNSKRSERHQRAGISYNRTFSERLLTYSRIGYRRNRNFGLANNATQSGLLESLGISGVEVEDPLEEGYPFFNLSGYADFGDRNSPSTSIRNGLELDNSLTYVYKNHTFRAGFEVGTTQLNNYRSDGLHRGSFNFNGDYTGDSFADFLLGFPDTAFRGIGSDRVDLRRTRWQFFFRDQWKLTPNFDFSYGVTYYFYEPYHSIHNNVSTFYPLLFEPPPDGEIIIAGSDRANEVGFGAAGDGSLVFSDKNDWAPSLGISYSPLGTNSLILRGSYSTWYDPPDAWYFVESLSRNYPFYYVESVEASGGTPQISIENPFEAVAVPELTIRGIEPHLNTAYIHFWRLSVQNEIARNWNLEMNYEGRKGSSMTRRIPGNVPHPGTGQIQERRPNSDFGKFWIVNDGGSFSGHGLDLSAEKRLSNGLSFRSGFEWNRIFDDASWGEPSNPRNLKAEKAAAVWVPEKRFFLNYIVELPFSKVANTSGWLLWALDGWRLSGITEIREGRFYSVVHPGDPNNDGVYGDRPDRIGSGFLSSSEQSIDQWFNTADFVEPEPYGFGNSGRNILRAPGYQAWDISVIKRTQLSDGDLVEFRVEFFNAFNQVNFQRPDASYDTSVFGKIFGADHAREIEVALKYSF